MRLVGIAAFAATMVMMSGSVFAQYPPPQSPEDSRCRGVAQAKVFSEPNPQGLSLYDHGYRIWAKCMRQAGAPVPGRKRLKRVAGLAS
jgi:hypothetical protein